jgi:hypothetical protein
MNERIKELAEQAKNHADYYAMLSDGIEQEIFTTKFAELIVRECALQCNHNDDMDRILEHFGVEE